MTMVNHNTKPDPLFTAADFPAWPQYDEKEEQALLDTLDEGQWGTLGKRVLEFSDKFAKYIGVKKVICVNTGTQALELLLRACGIGRGDEVIVPPYTFVATVYAIAWVGAMPVFADVDVNTGCLDPISVQQCITERTKAILAVHVAGRTCDMDALSAIAHNAGIYLLEDAAHAHGSEWKGRKAGSLADGAAFSFQSSKVLTGGEGGAIATNNEDIWARAWQYHNSGRAVKGGGELGGVVLMGTNGRMAEWEAAILLKQLDRLDAQCARRSEGAVIIDDTLRGTPGITLPPLDDRITAWSGFLYQFRWNGATPRSEFIKKLRERGLPCSAGYPALYNMGMLHDATFERSTGLKFTSEPVCPNTEQLAKEAVWFKGSALLAERDILHRASAAIAEIAQELG
ncbi:MAG: DegT/DnrJ/EryC1/StrS family aminotransferase [Clostridia bacterium]|nr:DegT/DnrJ/EryC1/StrS family aminotransferase [Clostridia bacterium]